MLIGQTHHDPPRHYADGLDLLITTSCYADMVDLEPNGCYAAMVCLEGTRHIPC